MGAWICLVQKKRLFIIRCFNYSVMARGWPHSFWQNSTTKSCKICIQVIIEAYKGYKFLIKSYISNNYWLLAIWDFNSSRFGDLPLKRFPALSRLRFPSHPCLHQYSTDLLFSSRTVFIISYTGVLRAFHRYIKEKLEGVRNWVLAAEISRPGSVIYPALNSSQSVYSTTVICNLLVLHNTNSVPIEENGRQPQAMPKGSYH
jgi:hypothetical protein